jgi:protein phosphatase 2C family protein 2/3
MSNLESTGREAADYCAETLYKNLTSDSNFREGRYKEAFENAFMKTDKDFIDHDKEAGTTAVTVLITQDKRIICSNAGDSRSVLSRGGSVVPLSIDHKPGNEVELRRIKAAGSVVSFDRVDGELAVARAVGDARFKSNTQIPLKDQAVTAFPEIRVQQWGEDVEFIIIACDGVWDVYSNEAAVQFVHARLRETRSITQIAEQFIDSALQLGSKDNITAMVIVFKQFLSKLPPAVPPPPPPAPAPADAKFSSLD